MRRSALPIVSYENPPVATWPLCAQRTIFAFGFWSRIHLMLSAMLRSRLTRWSASAAHCSDDARVLDRPVDVAIGGAGRSIAARGRFEMRRRRSFHASTAALRIGRRGGGRSRPTRRMRRLCLPLRATDESRLDSIAVAAGVESGGDARLEAEVERSRSVIRLAVQFDGQIVEPGRAVARHQQHRS